MTLDSALDRIVAAALASPRRWPDVLNAVDDFQREVASRTVVGRDGHDTP